MPFLKEDQFFFKNTNNYPTTTAFSYAESIGILNLYESRARQAPPPPERYDFKEKYASEQVNGRNYMRQTPKIPIFLMFSNEKLRGSCWVVVAIFKENLYFFKKHQQLPNNYRAISHAKPSETWYF